MGKVLSDEALAIIAERFKVLAEPIRLKMLQELRAGELSVSELTKQVGISQPNASKHLRTLQDAGLVRRDRRGNLAYYSIADDSIFELCEVVCDSLEVKFREKAEIFAAV